MCRRILWALKPRTGSRLYSDGPSGWSDEVSKPLPRLQPQPRLSWSTRSAVGSLSPRMRPKRVGSTLVAVGLRPIGRELGMPGIRLCTYRTRYQVQYRRYCSLYWSTIAFVVYAMLYLLCTWEKVGLVSFRQRYSTLLLLKIVRRTYCCATIATRELNTSSPYGKVARSSCPEATQNYSHQNLGLARGELPDTEPPAK